MTQVGKLFQQVPYFVRDTECEYKTIQEVEEVIDEFLSNYMMTIGNLVNVFSNNRDSSTNFHILVNGNMPKDSIYVDFEHSNFEITFEEYKESKTSTKKVNSLMFIEKFDEQKEHRLVKAFEAIIGCDGSKLFISLDKEKFDMFKPNSENYNHRVILLEKKDLVESLCEELQINSKSLYKELHPNMIKQVCKDLNITYKSLANEIGYKPDTINKAASTGKVSEQLQKAIEMYLENLRLKALLKDFDIMKSTLKRILE